jgi:hypothetical protein
MSVCPRPVSRHLAQVMFLLAFFLKGTVQVVGDVDGGRLDLD